MDFEVLLHWMVRKELYFIKEVLLVRDSVLDFITVVRNISLEFFNSLRLFLNISHKNNYIVIKN